MKNIISIISSFLMTIALMQVSHAQAVSINTDNSLPDASSILDVKSITKGMLIPRMTSAQRNAIALPASGLLVYDIDTQSFWYRSNIAWVNLSGGGGGWSMTGNVASGTDFLGTTNNQSLLFKANNIQAGKIDIFLKNTSWGLHAGESMTTGQSNTSIGINALQFNTSGYSNIAIGTNALNKNMTRANLVAVGDSALYNNETGASVNFHSTANTAIGSKALYSNTTGYQNTATGFKAMYSNTTGLQNSAYGVNTLYQNSSGGDNSAFGKDALFANTTGSFNSAHGVEALYSNSSGNNNTAIGWESLYSNTSGNDNTANGILTLFLNTTGTKNTAVGANALYGNTTGEKNSAVGMNVLSSNNDGTQNTAMGNDAMILNGSGSFNSAFGVEALFFNMNGNNNTAIGREALYLNSGGASNTATGMLSLFSNDGSFNTANGVNAMFSNNSGNSNSAFGVESLNSNTTGSNNTAIGWKSLFTNTTGSNNTAVGNAADVTGIDLTNATAIGYNAKVGASNSLVLGGTGADAVKVGIGTQTPSTTLEVNGQVKISGGAPGENKVLTSDATGLATWESPTPPSPEIAYIYNLTPTIIFFEEDIPFDTNGSLTGGFIHIPGSTDITIINTGMYKVNFSVSGVEPNQFTLFLNGIPLPGSTYGSAAGTQQNNGQVVFFASAFDILTLRNHSSSSAVTLSSAIGGMESSVNSSIIIQKL